jgi:hypothetical protein
MNAFIFIVTFVLAGSCSALWLEVDELKRKINALKRRVEEMEED